MYRKFFDQLITTCGLIISLIFIIIGGILLWTHEFVDQEASPKPVTAKLSSATGNQATILHIDYILREQGLVGVWIAIVLFAGAAILLAFTMLGAHYVHKIHENNKH